MLSVNQPTYLIHVAVSANCIEEVFKFFQKDELYSLNHLDRYFIEFEMFTMKISRKFNCMTGGKVFESKQDQI